MNLCVIFKQKSTNAYKTLILKVILVRKTGLEPVQFPTRTSSVRVCHSATLAHLFTPHIISVLINIINNILKTLLIILKIKFSLNLLIIIKNLSPIIIKYT